MLGVVVRQITPASVRPFCLKWVENVQRPHIEGNTNRADHDWDWLTLIPTLTFAAGARRNPRMFQICTAETGFPLAMISLLETERHPVDHSQTSVFAWYLAGAPSSAVEAQGSPKLLMSAALDVAITVSLNGPARGQLWLHAAPEGGQRLMDWYAKQSLVPIARNVRLPGSLVAPRRNDGRYFQLDPGDALRVSSRMDKYRNRTE
ncbi:MAG: hypothetical protein P4L66_04130 [Acetobacteraceae bacterium]|nr:hypothetical protein [Acetobacteraceae bacterium]